MSRQRSRSRSPLQLNSKFEGRNISSPTCSRSTLSGSEQAADCKVLHLRKIPIFWKHDRIKAFIKDSCKSRTVAENIKYVLSNDEEPGCCWVKFSTPFVCNMAFTELTGVEIQGTKLNVQFDTENRFDKRYKTAKPELSKRVKPKTTFQPQSVESNQRRPLQAPKFSPNTTDNLETYGLSHSFLSSLNIRPPLLTKIFIANLDNRVNEAKLREVFGSAGQIVNVLMIQKSDKSKLMAKIEYDHPVEAVQAISMFNKQELYNRVMAVHLDHAPRNNTLPEGLSSRGPGLGVNGEPLKGVRTHVELQGLKQMLMESVNYTNNNSNCDQQLNGPQLPQNDAGVNQLIVQNPIPAVNVTPFQPLANPFLGTNSLLNPQGVQNLQILQSLVQQNACGDLQSVLAALQGQNTQTVPNIVQNQSVITNQTEWLTQSQSSSRQSEMPSFYSREDNLNNIGRQVNNDDNRKNYESYRQDEYERDIPARTGDVDEPRDNSSDMLIFSNLPASVSVQALSSKMREVGALQVAELTGRGRALVRFCAPRDARRALQLFDRSKVDGQTIEVRFF